MDGTFGKHYLEVKRHDRLPGRVIGAMGHTCTVLCESGEYWAETSGRFRFTAERKADFPVVGDWVVAQPIPGEKKAVIHRVLPRRTAFMRTDPSRRVEPQVVSANIDEVFIVCGLDHEFNVRRIERYLACAWDSGAQPVVVLNKADVCADVGRCVAEAEAVSPGARVLAASALDGSGIQALGERLKPGRTFALLGSSGTGKSSLVNRLMGGDAQAVGEVRQDDGRGRHTTTHREMLFLPSGAMVLDNPGMREIKVWMEGQGLQDAFPDVEELAAGCRFSDCRHLAEPGCAVQDALNQGVLPVERYESYLELHRESGRSRRHTRAR